MYLPNILFQEIQKENKWHGLTKRETGTVRHNLDEILRTIEKLDREFPTLKQERKRIAPGDEILLKLMDDYGVFKSGNYYPYD